MQEITIIGLGYVGLPIAIAFAQSGIKVHGVDKSETVINKIIENNEFTEPFLKEKLSKVINKNLLVSTNINKTNTYIVTVQTPVNEDKTSDLTYAVSAIRDVAKVIKKNDLVIVESTLPPKANVILFNELLSVSKLKEDEINYCYCPESILPNDIFNEIENNSRVIGCKDKKSGLLAKELYSNICKGELNLCDIPTAEFVKLVQNTHRDIELAFVNELSMICDEEKIDVFNLINLSNKHPRCNLLTPGSGVGGHCIAVDPYFFVENYNTNIIKSAREVNETKPKFIAKKALQYANENKLTNICILGASYKSNIEDCRESSGIHIARLLKEVSDKNIMVCEPNVYCNEIYEFKNIELNEIDFDNTLLVLAQKHDFFVKNKENIQKAHCLDFINL